MRVAGSGVERPAAGPILLYWGLPPGVAPEGAAKAAGPSVTAGCSRYWGSRPRKRASGPSSSEAATRRIVGPTGVARRFSRRRACHRPFSRNRRRRQIWRRIRDRAIPEKYGGPLNHRARTAGGA